MQIGTASFQPNHGSPWNSDVSPDVSGLDRVVAAGQRIAPSRPLKVLLISAWFPPSNVIGAVRVGHFAKSLYETGHDVRVLAADKPGDRSLPLGIPADRVTYVRAPQGGKLLDPLIVPLLKLVRRLGRMRRKVASDQTASAAPQSSGSVRLNWRRQYYALALFPDANAPWMHNVTSAGRQLIKHWRPDIIIASAPPNSGLIAARRIARTCRAPWVADLRDLWADNSYYTFPLWRLWLDLSVERSILRSAAGLITVSPIWADILRRKYKQPVAC